jgi:hypothetical protein
MVQFLQVTLEGFLKVINRCDIKLVSQYSRCPPKAEIFPTFVSLNEIMYYSDMSRIAILKLLRPVILHNMAFQCLLYQYDSFSWWLSTEGFQLTNTFLE